MGVDGREFNQPRVSSNSLATKETGKADVSEWPLAVVGGSPGLARVATFKHDPHLQIQQFQVVHDHVTDAVFVVVVNEGAHRVRQGASLVVATRTCHLEMRSEVNL